MTTDTLLLCGACQKSYASGSLLGCFYPKDIGSDDGGRSIVRDIPLCRGMLDIRGAAIPCECQCNR